MNEDQKNLLLMTLEQPEFLTRVSEQAKALLRNNSDLRGYIEVEELVNVGWVKASQVASKYEFREDRGTTMITYLCAACRACMSDYLRNRRIFLSRENTADQYDAFVSVENNAVKTTHFYTMQQVENRIDYEKLMNVIRDINNAAEMVSVWAKGATFREIGEAFDIDFTWASRKIDGYISRIRSAVWADILTLKCS